MGCPLLCQLLVGIILSLPVVYPLSCDMTSFEKCDDYGGSEKDVLILALLHPEVKRPDFEFAQSWNVRYNALGKGRDSALIKDAWVKISSVTPTFLRGSTIFVPAQINVSQTFDYRIEPPPEDGCRMDYRITQNQTQLKLFNNGIIESSLPESSITTLSQNSLHATFEITVSMEVDHYTIQKRCVRYRSGECKQWTDRCERHSTDYIHDHLVVDDWIELTQIPGKPIAMQDIYREVFPVHGKISVENATGFELRFDHGYYSWYNTSYSLALNDGMMHFEEKSVPSTSQMNAIAYWENDSLYFVTPTIESCSIHLFNQFYEQTMDCQFSTHNTSSIYTDKAVYAEGESIIVSVLPRNVPANVKYNGVNYPVINNLSLIAKLHEVPSIEDEHGRESDATIHVKNPESIHFLSSVIWFLGISLFLYSLLRKYVPILL